MTHLFWKYSRFQTWQFLDLIMNWRFFLKKENCSSQCWELTLSLASIFWPPRNHSTTMSSYDSSHSKVAVSPAVTVTSVRGCISPMDRAAQEEDMVNTEACMGLPAWRPEVIWGLSCQKVCEAPESRVTVAVMREQPPTDNVWGIWDKSGTEDWQKHYAVLEKVGHTLI